ncbi:aminoglycoside 6-adenylyltransferase [Domibacillus sp. A3M-37]|uniref:aminoglycoside 6-adenylyltransferase n=1 Tax=Domibacillus sp. A3M-37 TaxID=2962037 RepID=UPI0020B6BBF8|nr:aminoglycoside 6-adenylyltransferase [Domibacillus sp. A3M-37]MCP3760955.1 aminoglycoside 6-adenylyltransferase [Domibacillus sp. A3M-37]
MQKNRRTDQDMMDLILKTAELDERIRLVGMNGSRVNRNALKDEFQDYDIVYAVTDLASFLAEPEWIDVFGERIIMQTPENMSLFPPQLGGRFSYLMLFTEGSRIDLTLIPLSDIKQYAEEDSLTAILLDKDQRFSHVKPPSDRDYWIQKPPSAFFQDCCNEFWWITTYVAKGLARGELLYAQEHLNQNARPMLLQMLQWRAGIDTQFSVSAGKSSKYFKKYLSEQEWNALLATFASGEKEDIWRALFEMSDLFRQTAIRVRDHFRFTYPHEDDRRVTQYLHDIKARSIF